MIPPTLAASVATSALGLISSVASNATSNNGSSNGTTGTNGTNGSGNIATGSTKAPTDKQKDVVNQAEFMKLLVAQLANQDPLNPLDSANFSAQLAQFSSLEQLTQINAKLDAANEEQIGRFEAVGFIGREVTGPSLGIAIEDGTPTTLDYTLDRGGAVHAKIISPEGEMIASVPLGPQSAGKHVFDLSKVEGAPDLEDGEYAVVLTQADPAGGAADQIKTTVTGRVTGVDLTGDEPILLLGSRRLVLTDVTSIKEPLADAA
jgi:flagellar basal-body rod modification protein FlgD